MSSVFSGLVAETDPLLSIPVAKGKFLLPEAAMYPTGRRFGRWDHGAFTFVLPELLWKDNETLNGFDFSGLNYDVLQLKPRVGVNEIVKP